MGERKIIWDTDRFSTPIDSSCSIRKDSLLVFNPEFVVTVQQFSADYSHLSVTTGKKESTLQALKQAGLYDEYIPYVLSGEQIDIAGGRMYRPVASSVGIDDDNASKAKIIVVGNQPTDIEGMVTIKPPAFCGGLEIVRDTIRLLERAGDGNFNRGFSYLYYQQPSIIEREGLWFEQRYAKLCEGQAVMLNYCDRDGFGFGEKPRRFPVVEIVAPHV